MKGLIDAINDFGFSIRPAVLVPLYEIRQVRCCFLRLSFCLVIENRTECLGWNLQLNQLLKKLKELFALQDEKFTALSSDLMGCISHPRQVMNPDS